MKSKKNKLTNLLKTGILFFGISLLLWNCENQNESIIEATISLEDSNNYPNKISSIPLQELPFNLQETISKSKTLLKSKNETSVIFDSEIILKNVDSLKNINYSVRFYLKNQPENVLYNLIVSSEESNTPPYVLKFIIENFEEIKKDDEILDFSSMKGVFEKYSYNSFISNSKYKNKTSNYDPCNRYRFSVVNFIRIRYVPYNSGRSGGGGGGSVIREWGAPTFTFPAVYSLKTASKNDCDQIRNIGGSGGGGGGGGNSVAINTGSGVSRKICNNGRFINGECVPYSDLYQIDASELTGKAKCVYGKMVDSKGNINWILENFKDGNKPSEFDLKFVMGTFNNPLTNASTVKNGNTFTIKINKNTLSGRTTLGLVRTIIHEGIHARLREFASRKGSNATTFPSIYEYYREYKNNWDHQQMADYYRSTIAKGLKQFDNGQHSNQFYNDMTWEGLANIVDANGIQNKIYTEAWKKLTLTEKNRIKNTITNEKKNGNKTCK
jgi:hypothetical protein